MSQSANNFAPSKVNNAGTMPNPNFHIHTAPQNTTFEFYLALPNDTRIYHVIYTELNPLETAQRLNDSINLSHIPNHQFQHHRNMHSLIQQHIQQVQYQSQQQSLFGTSQVYSDDNAASGPSNVSVSNDLQDTDYDASIQNEY